MNGLVSAAAEAEAIIKKVRWSNQAMDLNYDIESDCLSEPPARYDPWGSELFSAGYGRKQAEQRRAHNSLSHLHSPPSNRTDRSSQSLSPVKNTARFNIHEKLRELYDELKADGALQANYQGLMVNSYLLEKLLTRMNLNVLIINLYPGNKGYSISLHINGDTHTLPPPGECNTTNNYRKEETLVETARWPYEEEDLLTYIDNEELPIVLLDLLEAEHSSLFYSGCIIAQVRDYRQAYPSQVCDTHHVLLKPTTQSIINDVNAMSRGSSWSREERLLLESAVVLATAPPLCLEPRPAVGLLAARLHHQRHLLATPAIRRQAKRYSQVAVNRKRRLDQLTQQRGLSLLDIITRHRARATPPTRHTTPNAAPRASAKFLKKPSEVVRPILAPRAASPVLSLPADAPGAVSRLARLYERPRPSSDCAPQLMEEYVLETERAPPQPPLPAPAPAPGVFHIKLSILQRPSNQEYLGELYVDRDHVEGERNGSACRFLLGTRAHANRYIQQFTEIFTEEGRKSVRIKHLVPGQMPRVTYTAGMRDLSHAAQLALQARAQQSVAASPGAAGAVPSGSSVLSVQVVGNVAGKPAPGSLVAPLTSPAPSAIEPTPPRRTVAANLPLLQAQLQAGPATVQQLQQLQSIQQPATSPAQPGSQLEQAQAQAATKAPPPQQIPTTIQHIQLHQGPRKQSPEQLQPGANQLQGAQQTANQLLAQQLTNPPQPINPHKLQQTILHIQNPLSNQLLQQKVVTCQAQIQGQPQHVTIQSQPNTGHIQGITLQGQQGIKIQGQPGITLQGQPGITLQGQQGITLQGQGGITLGQQAITLQSQLQAQQQKAAPVKQRTTNPAISALVTSLMNSAHQFQQAAAANAAMLNNSAGGGSANASGSNIPSNNATILNLLNSAPAAMTNTQAAQAQAQAQANASADGSGNKKPTAPSALLERLMAPPAPSSNTQQSLSLMQGLQNVQVQIPGLAQPISLSLNVSAAGGGQGLLVTVPASQSTPTSTQSLLSLPITHLIPGGVKTGTPLQLVQRPRVAPRQLPTKLPTTTTVTVPAGAVQYLTQQSATLVQQRRRSNPNEPNK